MTTIAEQIDDSKSLLNINMINITKLSSTNFMTWNLQVHALLGGYNLAGHIDGITTEPDKTITVDGVITVNPYHTKW